MKVVCVEPVGIADVYNMTVEDTHDFVLANGIVTHNCDEIRYMCMSHQIPPRKIEKKTRPLSDPLNQFGQDKGRYSKYNAIRLGG